MDLFQALYIPDPTSGVLVCNLENWVVYLITKAVFSPQTYSLNRESIIFIFLFFPACTFHGINGLLAKGGLWEYICGTDFEI